MSDLDQHTPGPWHIVDWITGNRAADSVPFMEDALMRHHANFVSVGKDRGGGSNDLVALVAFRRGDEESEARARADAALIAAAPALLKVRDYVRRNLKQAKGLRAAIGTSAVIDQMITQALGDAPEGDYRGGDDAPLS